MAARRAGDRAARAPRARQRPPGRSRRSWRRRGAITSGPQAARIARMRSRSAPVPTLTLSVWKPLPTIVLGALRRGLRSVRPDGPVAGHRGRRGGPEELPRGKSFDLADQIEHRDVDCAQRLGAGAGDATTLQHGRNGGRFITADREPGERRGADVIEVGADRLEPATAAQAHRHGVAVAGRPIRPAQADDDHLASLERSGRGQIGAPERQADRHGLQRSDSRGHRRARFRSAGRSRPAARRHRAGRRSRREPRSGPGRRRVPEPPGRARLRAAG